MDRTTAEHAEAPAAAAAAADYEAPEVLLVRAPEQLKALGDELRGTIVALLRDRARSVTELAERLGLPKGTVGHHVKVLEKAGLVKVVRTRKVRAVTEKYYGRTAKLFLYESQDPGGAEDIRNIVAMSLRVAAAEILPADADDPEEIGSSGALRVRLTHADAVRLNRRLDRLIEDFRAADNPDGRPYGLAVAMYRRAADA